MATGVVARHRAVVLGEAFQRLPREIEAVELRVLALQRRDDAQALRVVVEAAEGLHRPVERALAGVPERRVAEIVGERDGFGQILIKAQLARHGARDLRHLQRVRQPRAVVIALVEDEDLRLVGQAPEGGRMQDAVAVALERAARRALGLGARGAHGSARRRPNRRPATARRGRGRAP